MACVMHCEAETRWIRTKLFCQAGCQTVESLYEIPIIRRLHPLITPFMKMGILAVRNPWNHNEFGTHKNGAAVAPYSAVPLKRG